MKPSTVQLRVKVTPGAKASQLVSYTDGVLSVRIAARPEKNRANRELVDFVADSLNVNRSAVRLKHGLHGRNKQLEIVGLSAAACARRLSELLSSHQ